jgi:hypothetical protein
MFQIAGLTGFSLLNIKLKLDAPMGVPINGKIVCYLFLFDGII